MLATEPGKPGKISMCLEISDNLEKSGKTLKKYRSGKSWRIIVGLLLDSQLPCSKIGVARKVWLLVRVAHSHLTLLPLVRE